MIVEVMAVGTELLLGDMVNSNAATIGRKARGDDERLRAFAVTAALHMLRTVLTAPR